MKKKYWVVAINMDGLFPSCSICKTKEEAIRLQELRPGSVIGEVEL